MSDEDSNKNSNQNHSPLSGQFGNTLTLVFMLAIFGWITYEGVTTGQPILILLGGIGVLVFLWQGTGRDLTNLASALKRAIVLGQRVGTKGLSS